MRHCRQVASGLRHQLTLRSIEVFQRANSISARAGNAGSPPPCIPSTHGLHATMTLDTQASKHKPLRIGVIGASQYLSRCALMGPDFVTKLLTHVGAGGNTKLHHIPKLQSIEDVEVVAVANRSLESAKRVTTEFGIAKVGSPYSTSDIRVLRQMPELYRHACFCACKFFHSFSRRKSARLHKSTRFGM